MTTETPVTPALPAGPAGLEGVILGPTSLSFLDGVKGRMLYRGYDAIELSGKVTYEEVAYLLWEGDLPTASQLAAFKSQLAPKRILPEGVVRILKELPRETHSMAALRTGVSALGNFDPDAADSSPAALRRKSERLMALLPVLVAARGRIRKGLEPIAPNPDLSRAANFLYMLTGTTPPPLDVEALDMYMTLLADHDMNASTFTAVVVTSTLSDLHSAITAAVGALKGILHGGANEKAMEMFLAIDDSSKAEAYIDGVLARKEKIMGFGHRVYKNIEDPRSVPLKAMAKRLAEAKKETRWFDISVKVAEAVHKRKKIETNVDFYSAPLLYQLGISIDMFTPIFAVARIAGWCAHVMEQLQHNRLIRPATHYIGPTDRVFVPLDKRK